MKKLLASLLMCSMMSLSATGMAETPKLIVPDTVAGEPDVGAAISPMKKGQIAPFTGVLLSPRAAASITVDLENVDEKVTIAVNRARDEEKAVCKAKTNEVSIQANADKEVLQARLDASLKQNNVLNEKIKKEEEDRPNVAFWTIGGAVGGIVSTVLIVIATK